MDSVSQFALGAALGVGVMGRRTAAWKAALWGGALGTLPDLDALIDHGDPVLNMVLHRAETHAVFWQSLASVPLAAGITAWMTRSTMQQGSAAHQPLSRQARWSLFRGWLLTVWLVLVTHALLDAMTVYGTRLGLPFTPQPVGLGSIFIIDPLYTLPLLVGLACALWRRGPSASRWNLAGLILSTVYLAWSAAAQQHVKDMIHKQLAQQADAASIERVLITPTPFNTVLWRVVVMREDSYQEGFYALADRGRLVRWTTYPRDAALYAQVAGMEAVGHIATFSRGFFRVDERDGVVRITDLRMGQEPAYVFSFAMGQHASPVQALQPPRAVGGRTDFDVAAGMRWLWARAQGDDIDPPGIDQVPRLRVLTCDVAYLPARSTWSRRVVVHWQAERLLGLQIDGVKPHAVLAEGQALATAIDNERIQLDLSALEWVSDYRGQASGRGRCTWLH